MKKISLFSTIFVLACLVVQAQDSSGLSQGISFRNAVSSNMGVKFGSVYSFHPKENTVGTPYLYTDWGRLWIDSMDNKRVARSVVYDANIDLEKNMLIVKGGDGKAYAPEVNDVQAFHFKKGNEENAFVAMQLDGVHKFVEQLAAGKYRLVKDVKVTFQQADFVDKGMVQTGKNYDEYKKAYTYYLVKDQVPVKVSIRKKALLEALGKDPDAQAAARKFLNDYREPFDETAARLMIEAINK
ncbi:hypothetical protein [Chitinophaga qingshengii]|uniref:DUF4369 domain-containing protein n=1 Tax=Chitinophaga qingshengii TaxID=1569794 RepID=A0ABR7TSH0_9BACT|nr:hypothetical protein [Chitinophaga qingshengii]MBC9932533.1 hypothetical protein [Chitinophaga qingshengii]